MTGFFALAGLVLVAHQSRRVALAQRIDQRSHYPESPVVAVVGRFAGSDPLVQLLLLVCKAGLGGESAEGHTGLPRAVSLAPRLRNSVWLPG